MSNSITDSLHTDGCTSSSFSARLFLVALSLLAFAFIAGCATTEPSPEPEPVAMNYEEPEVEVPDMFTIQVYYQATGLHKDARQQVDNYVSSLSNPGKLHFTVSGYTCTEGNRSYNKKLSKWRADAVKREMVKMGIDPDSITTRGFGVDNPIASNKTRMGRVKNRRVTITATKAY